jgi:hypothetical protein
MHVRSLAMEFITEEEVQAPITPIARIYVQKCISCAGGTHHYLSCDCITPEEWDWEINRLKAELEFLRREGHAQFAAKRQTREFFSF